MGSGVVSTFGSPPPDDTESSPVTTPAGAKTIVPSAPQLAPRGAPTTRHTVTTGPPLMATFFSSPVAKNPIHRPSGDRKGDRAPLIGRATPSSWSSARTMIGPAD